MGAFDDLTGSFSRLPGIGKKSAVRIVNWLLKQDKMYVQRFAQNLAVLQERVKPCSVCGAWTEDEMCPICSDPLRDSSVVCVVEQPQDVSTIEAYGEFRGVYHVLGGLIKPLDGIGPSQLAIAPLLARIRRGGVKEIIIATNPTVEGDTTALYLNKVIGETGGAGIGTYAAGGNGRWAEVNGSAAGVNGCVTDVNGRELDENGSEAVVGAPIKVTRLATGIPVGGDLEYIDKRTLALSFRGRSQM